MPIDPTILHNALLFQLLDPTELADLAAHIDEQSFSANQAIFKAGDPGGKMYIVLDGKVQTYLIDDDKQKVILSEVEKGEMFGELSLLDGDPRKDSSPN